jgi:chemotaxis protein histidine kinase CheA
MNYYEAAKIRKKGFADLMTDKLTSGQGVFSSARSALSDRSKARSLGLKEKFDPLNIAKVLTGGSNLAPAMLGKLLGRKPSDIKYFSGKKEYTPRRESSYFNNYTPSSMSTGGSRKATRVLQKMLSFMEKSRVDDMQEQDTLDSFNELNENMREDRHKEVLNVFIEATKVRRKAIKHMAKEAKKRQAQEKAETKTGAPSAPSAPTKPTKTAPPAQTAPKPGTQAKDAADAASAAKKAKDAADAASAAKKAKDAADAAKKAKEAKDAADAASAAKKAKDAADAASAAKKAKDAADAAKKAKDAADAKRIKDAADAKKAADTAKKQEPIPTAQPSATKIITGAATVTAVLTGREALATNISKYESGEKGYNAYNRGDFWLAKRDEGKYLQKNDIDFSKMTITDYLKRTNKKLNAGGLLDASDPNVLFAVGKYQIIPGTMKVMAEKLGLNPDKTYLTPEIQDMLFAKGLTTKGNGGRFAVDDYISGKQGATRDAAILALAMEFASVGVPYDIKAKSLFKNTLPKVDLKKGETFYKAPGGFNKAHNSPEEVGAALDADRASKAKLQTNDTTVGSSLNDSSMKNADMKKDMSQGSSGGSTVIVQNNNTTQAKTNIQRTAPQEQLNPTMR